MPPNSTEMLSSRSPLEEKLSTVDRRENGIQEKPTSLVEVVKHLPEDVFEKRPFRAYMAAFQAIFLTAASAYVLYHTESYLGILFGWFMVGTCATGMFVIGHECAHGSFGKSTLEEEIVGTIMMSPLSWPYHGWLNTHNHHHSYTNQIGKDHLWNPLLPEFIDKCSKPILLIMEYLLVGPLFFESSIAHHIFHFNVFDFPKRVRASVARSIAFTLLTCFGMWYQLYTTGGMFLVFKMWFMPYLVFNFWLSTYTYFHHKSLDIPWLEKDKWNKAQAQLFHTAHVDYHPIFELLHFDINWHIPHHVSVKIPWYNLRRATYALVKVYGKNIRMYEMSWSFWKEVTSSCHVHDKEKNYISLKEYESNKSKNE